MVTHRYEYLYTDNTPDSVKCAKCHEIPERVYRDCELELLFCQNCRSRTSMYDTYLQHILDQCLVMCPNKDCDLVCKRGELLAHLADKCDKQVMPCENGDVGCKWYSEKENHSKHECQFEFIAAQLRTMMGMIRDAQVLKLDNEIMRKRIDFIEEDVQQVQFVPAPATHEVEVVEFVTPIVLKKRVQQKPRKDPQTFEEMNDLLLKELQQRLKLRAAKQS